MTQPHISAAASASAQSDLGDTPSQTPGPSQHFISTLWEQVPPPLTPPSYPAAWADISLSRGSCLVTVTASNGTGVGYTSLNTCAAFAAMVRGDGAKQL